MNNSKFSKCHCSFPQREIIPHLFYVLFVEDKLWYRSRIVAKKSKTFQVEYIDYGNFSEVPVEEVYQLSKEMTEVPPLALKLHLDGE